MYIIYIYKYNIDICVYMCVSLTSWHFLSYRIGKQQNQCLPSPGPTLQALVRLPKPHAPPIPSQAFLTLPSTPRDASRNGAWSDSYGCSSQLKSSISILGMWPLALHVPTSITVSCYWDQWFTWFHFWLCCLKHRSLTGWLETNWYS